MEKGKDICFEYLGSSKYGNYIFQFVDIYSN